MEDPNAPATKGDTAVLRADIADPEGQMGQRLDQIRSETNHLPPAA
jgi:hypothetical protein